MIGRSLSTRSARGLGAALMALALAMPSAVAPYAAQAAPAATPVDAPGCLIGMWSAVDVETYARSALNSGTSSVTVDSVTGNMRLLVRSDDTFSQYFDDAVVRAHMRGTAVVQTINGDARGRLEEDATGQLLFSGEAGAITMDMTIDDQPFVQGADVSALALASREFGPTRAAYSCEGDRLELTPRFPDGRPVQPMVFWRAG